MAIQLGLGVVLGLTIIGAAPACAIAASNGLALPLVGTLAQAPSGAYSVEPVHTSVTWRISHHGMSAYTARFDKTSGHLIFDSRAPAKSTLEIEVDPASVSTAYPRMDTQLLTEPYFNTTVFPKIVFRSRKVEQTGPRTGVVTGDLTFRGVTRPLALDVTWNGVRDHPFLHRPWLGFSAHATLHRSDFGFSYLLPVVGDDIDIAIEAEFVRDQ